MTFRTRLGWGLVAIALVLLASCAPRRLTGPGRLRLWSQRPETGLTAALSKAPGVSLDLDATKAPPAELAAQEGGPELFYIEWGSEYFEALRAGAFADLSTTTPSLDSLYPALRRSGELRPFPVSDSAAGPSFVPVLAAPWGLYYNEELLASAGLGGPETWKDLASGLEALERAGVEPLAVGAASGWTGLAWLSLLDLRLNGAEEHRLLLEGKRRFDDPGLLGVCRLLASWRDAGWFGGSPGTEGWAEALAAVAGGRAALCYLNGALGERFAGSRVGFAAAPPLRGGRGPRGELASQWGLAFSSRRSPEGAASAYAEALLSSTAPLGDPSLDLVFSRRPKAGEGGTSLFPAGMKPEGRRLSLLEAETRVLQGAEQVFPSLDEALPAQAAYDMARAMSAFFASRTMTGKELAALLQASSPRSSEGAAP